MSQQLISRNDDLKRLRDDGYHVDIVDNHLVIRDIPYVDSNGSVRKDGILISTLELAGDETKSPISDHVAHFIGEKPCDAAGQPLSRIIHSEGLNKLGPELTATYSFSTKPKASGAYTDYYEKMTTIATILVSQAQSIDPEVKPQTFPVVEDEREDSVFDYLDTASSRAEIVAISAKLALARVAIVGLGGSGSYILDYLAKTPIGEIHLFDGDSFDQHTAFRSPGAASKAELQVRMKKVVYYASRYAPMRRGIVPHDQDINPANIDQLAGMDFVFVAVDNNAARRMLVDYLTEATIDFIDVGMGVDKRGDSLAGQVRVTASTAKNRDFMQTVTSKADAVLEDEYATNIQVVELNALSAALAVIRWKKHVGFYQDLEGEHQSVYAIDGNQLVNDAVANG
ncbi:MAG: ThiF family adenylyltransferase [Acidimicrobiia bacterium]